MAMRVDEIMNRELFAVRPEDRAEDALGFILALGVTGAPVVDDAWRPLGVVSFRDLLGRREGATARDRMTAPAVSVRPHTGIEEAARLLADSGVHRLVVVDEGDRAVGIVSSVDLIRGLLGMPAAHPSAFPHYDPHTGLVWTEDIPFEASRIEAAPAGPGVLLLVQGGRGAPDAVLWGEATHDVRARLLDLLTLPQAHAPLLARVLSRVELRFRAAATEDLDFARRVAERALRDESARQPQPSRDGETGR